MPSNYLLILKISIYNKFNNLRIVNNHINFINVIVYLIKFNRRIVCVIPSFPYSRLPNSPYTKNGKTISRIPESEKPKLLNLTKKSNFLFITTKFNKTY